MNTIKHITSIFTRISESISYGDVALMVKTIQSILAAPSANCDCEIYGDQYTIAFDINDSDCEINGNTEPFIISSIYYDSVYSSCEITTENSVKSVLSRENMYDVLKNRIASILSDSRKKQGMQI